MTNDLTPDTPPPFEQIRRINDAGNEYWSSRDFARVLGYSDYRNFESVVGNARTACFNSGQRVDDHFVEITDMIEVGKINRPREFKLVIQLLHDPETDFGITPKTARIGAFDFRASTRIRRQPSPSSVS